MAETKHTSISLHAHGDGSYHTHSPARSGDSEHYGIGDGKEPGRVEHESFGHAVAHMAKHHAAGEHLIIEGHENGFTSHHIDDGEVEGPTEHKGMRELKRHVSDCMGSGE